MPTDKRTAILNAALDSISQYGFQGTPMATVARKAGVSAGIIYHYFESKEQLINELYRQIKKQFLEYIDVDLPGQMPIFESFRLLWLKILNYYATHSREIAFVEQYESSPHFSPASGMVEYSIEYESIEKYIHKALEQGLIKDLPPAILITFTGEAAISVAKKITSAQLEMNEAMINTAIQASWDAIKR